MSLVNDVQPVKSIDGATTRRQVALRCLAIVSVVTAVIHFAVAGEHFQEYWVFGVFMLAVAVLQGLWAIAVINRPGRALLAGGAVLNAAVVGVYILTRTVGDMIGPTPHEVEPFGFGDGLCTVLEAVIVVGAV
jgi:4-amino-4-deoxy-L-arabinose transferase-like glycosyltransferase